MKKKIKSWWTYEKGRWSNKTAQYANRTTSKPVEKLLEIELITLPAGPAILFHGGPTGYEGYYVADIFFGPGRPAGGHFCICAGTINAWARCWVLWGDVLQFLKENGYER